MPLILNNNARISISAKLLGCTGVVLQSAAHNRLRAYKRRRHLGLQIAMERLERVGHFRQNMLKAFEGTVVWFDQRLLTGFG